MGRCVAAILLLTLAAFGADKRPILVLMQFEQDHSEVSIAAMKREFAEIMKAAGLEFDHKLRSELSEFDTPADIIMVKFKGQCRMKLLPELFDERGPFATTQMQDGQMQSFSEVACDRVRVSVRSAMTGTQLKDGETVLGRALGRVLAHEVYHIVSKSPHHGATGVARRALTGSELTADRLQLDPKDVEKMYSLP
jgi:hypothetical protein